MRTDISKELHPAVADAATISATKTMLSEVRELLGGYGDKKADIPAAVKRLADASAALASAPSAGAAPAADPTAMKAAVFPTPVQFALWANSQFNAAKTESGAALTKRMTNLGKAFNLAKAHWDDTGDKPALTIEMESHFVGTDGTKASDTAMADQSSKELAIPLPASPPAELAPALPPPSNPTAASVSPFPTQAMPPDATMKAEGVAALRAAITGQPVKKSGGYAWPTDLAPKRNGKDEEGWGSDSSK